MGFRALLVGTLVAVVSACDEDESCRNRDVSSCTESSECRQITGTVQVEDGGVEERELGCDERARVCGAAATCAEHSETGALAVFPSTCTPLGWVTRTDDACATIQRSE